MPNKLEVNLTPTQKEKLIAALRENKIFHTRKVKVRRVYLPPLQEDLAVNSEVYPDCDPCYIVENRE